MTRVVIADDHPVIRHGLKSLLQENSLVEVVGEATDGAEAVEKVRALKPDLVILDYAMPVLNGLEATRLIRAQAPRTEVLIFSGYDSEDIVLGSVMAGARGYVLKTEADNVIRAVEAVAVHRPFFSWQVSEHMLNQLMKQGISVEDTGPLSAREREVVRLIAAGGTNKTAAQDLGITIKTVESHRSTAMRKLNAGSTADLVRYAVRHGLIDA